MKIGNKFLRQIVITSRDSPKTVFQFGVTMRIDCEHLTPCPRCGADLTEAHSRTRPTYRTIGVYDVDRDMTVEWMCPDCGGRWPRGYREDPFVTFAKKVRKDAGVE